VPIIVDASVALAWAMPDERGEAAIEILDAVQNDVVVVPGHFRAEVANGLKIGEPRRISEAEIAQFVRQLCKLEIAVDHEGSEQVFERVLPLAREHKLTVYDALYLELAERRGLTLASFDGALLAAARKAGVTVLP
jgi:predicted nucleic acid-binding protein